MNHLVSSIIAGVGTTIAIGLLAFADNAQSELIFLMAPLGASAVLIFGVPDSPLAQPKNVIVGHLITALIGVLFVNFLPITPWSLALATGLAVTTMLATKTTHPPAGANPIMIMMAGSSWSFLLFPVLVGPVVIVLIGKLISHIKSTLTQK